ncbi:MAG TPA: MerR family transcriptional regulator [Steroidobacteraceae bacterium]|nr:MerR family transcriptional regulator [Steroidobacteraceae bacterium]
MRARPVERLPIRVIASLTGVKPMTLRAWERRYGLIRPQRTPKGHRLYTHQHVERIRRVLTLIERGVPVGRVRDLLDADPSPAAETSGPWRHYLERMAGAIARFDELELDRIHEEALSMHPIEQVTQRLYLPLLAHLGERWRDLAGAIAEEHFFAMYLRSKLGARLQHRARYASGPLLLGACIPGEQHELGLLLFALEANGAGLRTVLLGADTPLADIAVASNRSGCEAVVVSSSIDPAPEFFRSGLPALVRAVHVPVFVGGSTATRHAAAIRAAGAVPLGSELDAGVRAIAARLGSRKDKR